MPEMGLCAASVAGAARPSRTINAGRQRARVFNMGRRVCAEISNVMV
jgi:hypothetical protein